MLVSITFVETFWTMTVVIYDKNVIPDLSRNHYYININQYIIVTKASKSELSISCEHLISRMDLWSGRAT